MAKDIDHIRETKQIVFENPKPSPTKCGITILGIPNKDDCDYFCLYVDGQERTLNAAGICAKECAFGIFKRKEG